MHFHYHLLISSLKYYARTLLWCQRLALNCKLPFLPLSCSTGYYFLLPRQSEVSEQHMQNCFMFEARSGPQMGLGFFVCLFFCLLLLLLLLFFLCVFFVFVSLRVQVFSLHIFDLSQHEMTTFGLQSKKKMCRAQIPLCNLRQEWIWVQNPSSNLFPGYEFGIYVNEIKIPNFESYMEIVTRHNKTGHLSLKKKIVIFLYLKDQFISSNMIPLIKLFAALQFYGQK